MFLGALLDLGLKRKELEGDLAGLDLEFSLKVRKVKRGALAARYVDVVVPSAICALHHKPLDIMILMFNPSVIGASREGQVYEERSVSCAHDEVIPRER